VTVRGQAPAGPTGSSPQASTHTAPEPQSPSPDHRSPRSLITEPVDATTWWPWRGARTRSHPELGRENPQRPWYCVSRHGRVGRRQVFPSTHTASTPHNKQQTRHTHAGWSSPVARQAHNLKVTGSNPVPATSFTERRNRSRSASARRRSQASSRPVANVIIAAILPISSISKPGSPGQHAPHRGQPDCAPAPRLPDFRYQPGMPCAGEPRAG